MRADRDIFIDQIRQFDTDTLLSLAVSLYDELSRLRMIQLENERISTEAHIQFSELNEKYAAIVRENEDLNREKRPEDKIHLRPQNRRFPRPA